VRYTSQINKIDPQQIVRGMTADRRENPMRAASIDLVRPTKVADMRPQALPYYADAFQRKAMRVTSDWAARAGEAAIPKVLTALRAKVPDDGPGLVALIQKESGIDLSSDVKPAP
jgi:hypothetical protein